MQPEKKSNYPSNTFGRFWMKVPLVIRSILSGFAISSLGIGIWVIMFTHVPVPWSFIGMGMVLILFWMYFSGKWNPSNTQDFRRFCMRQIKMERPVWIWGLTAAFFLFLFFHSGWILTFRIVEFQPEIFKTARYANDYPAWASWSLILMASLVAGICEEIGYRGYMQKPIEQKYGPVAGIVITAIMFVMVHLHQAWMSDVLMHMLIISFMAGILAYSSDSLLPGIIAHVSLDIINFSYWWSDVLGTFERKPISMTGVDNHFIITIIIVLFSTILFIVAIRKLLKLKKLDRLGD